MVCLIWGRLRNCVWTRWWMGGPGAVLTFFSRTEVITHVGTLRVVFKLWRVFLLFFFFFFFCQNANREPSRRWLEYRVQLICQRLLPLLTPRSHNWLFGTDLFYVHFGSFTGLFSLLIVTLEQHGFERQRSELWCHNRIQIIIEVAGPLNQYSSMEVAIFVLSLKHADLFPWLSLTR